MNILQIANGYVEKKLYKNLFEKLEEKSNICNMIFVAVNFGYNKSNESNSNVTVSECFSNIDRLIFFSKQRKIFKVLEKTYDFKKIDLIHAHTLFSNGYAAYKLNKKYGIPYLVAVRDTDVNVFFKKMIHLRKIGIKIIDNACSVVFLSSTYKQQVINEYIPNKLRKDIEKKCYIIPNGIDDFFFEKKISTPKEIGDVITLIHVGDISTRKNISETVKAVKTLQNEGYQIKYRVVGEIKEKKFQRMIETEKFIDYYPKCNQQNLISHYAVADILCVPSHYETFGLVYAEAMSQGLPVIYTRGQGFDGQFNDWVVGSSVDDRNYHELVDVIKKIINRYTELSENCIKEVEKFRWNKIAKQYLFLYERYQRNDNN